MPNPYPRALRERATFHERVTLYLGGKEIQVLYLGRGHTRGDSIVYVPEDRIAYLSELFFSEQFPNMVDGYGVAWLETLNAIESPPSKGMTDGFVEHTFTGLE
jgi:glyoxylase-like metal-dependent hydrolase (beta-lactamase superfamily II)